MSDEPIEAKARPSSAPVYRALEAADEPALFSAYERWLDDGARIAELYEWRREGAPASGGVRPTIALLDGELIGSVSAVPVRVRLRGREIAAAWQQDSVVGPPARGKGVGKRLVAESSSGYDLLLAKSTSEAMYALRKSVGFADVPLRTFMVRVLSPFSAGSAAKRAAYLGLWLAQQARAPWRARTMLAAAPIDRFGPAFDRLAQKAAAGDELVVHKGADYLNWRYLECPGRRYEIRAIDDGGDTRGAVVIRLNERPGERAFLVDIVCDTRDTPAMDALLGEALREARAARAGDLLVFSSSARVRRRLARHGFTNTGRTPQFTFRVESPELRPAIADAGWNFWLGDGDSELY